MSLVERIERASGPDRELDKAIALSLGWKARSGAGFVGIYDDDRGLMKALPRFTFSIDAAMTLVPEDCLMMTRELWFREGKAGLAAITHYKDSMWSADFQGVSSTPALALCAAALRAREVSNG